MRTLPLLLFLPFSLIGQPPTDRYQVDLFNVTEINDITFSSGVPQPNEGGGFYEFITGFPLNVEEYNTSPVDLKMDIFLPAGDTLEKRPLVIVCFGGGFLSGSKDHWSMRLICQNLAKRGYVAAAIDYRLGMNIFDSDLANRAVYRGLQDARSAVRFFREDAANADIYKVDPDHIFIGGHSSGGFMALHNAYLDKEIERPLSTYEWVQDGEIVPDQGCIDCVGNNTGYSGHANAIFSLAGALGFTSFMESATDPNVVMFHSTDDGTVPYDSGEPFSSILWLVVGSDLPDVYGSLPISEQADVLGLPYDFFSYSNRGHDVHESSSSTLYSDIIPGISDWFFDEEIKPLYESIEGDSIICSSDLTRTYALKDGEGVYFDWVVDGGTFIDFSNYSDQVTISWNPVSANHSLKVTPYNQMDAKGEEIELSIDVQQSNTNNFLHNNSNWTDVNNWSLSHIPIACENVTINNTISPFEISLSTQTEINSLFIDSDINLTLNQELTIYQKTTSSSSLALDLLGNIENMSTLTILSNSNVDAVKIQPSGILTNSGIIHIKE